MSLQDVLQGGLLAPPQRRQPAWSFVTGSGLDEETARRARMAEELLVGARNDALSRRMAIEALEAGAQTVVPSALAATAATGRRGIPVQATPATPVIDRAQRYLDAERMLPELEAGPASYGPSYMAGTAGTGRRSPTGQGRPATPVVDRAQRYLDAEKLASSLEAPAALMEVSPLLTTAATGRVSPSIEPAAMQRSSTPADVAAAVTPEVVAPGSRYSAAAGQARKAGSRLLDAVNPFTTKDGKITGLRGGRVAGAGTILSLLAAANELNDPTESAGRNLAQAAGVGAGGVGGGLAGAAIGQALIPIPGVGALVGATLGGLLGTETGRGLASFAADIVEGSPEDRQIRRQQKMARAAAESEAERIRTLMPLQDQAAQIALRNEEARQKMLSGIAAEQMVQRALAEGLLAQQSYGAQQQLAMTNAILGGV